MKNTIIRQGDDTYDFKSECENCGYVEVVKNILNKWPLSDFDFKNCAMCNGRRV